MLLVFVHKLFIHHILKYPSSAILWQQDTVQYNTIHTSVSKVLFFCYTFGMRFVGVSSLGTSHVSQPVDHAQGS